MNIKELAEKHYVCIEFERGDVHACYEFSITELEQFAELVAAHEREECAKLCEGMKPFGSEIALQKATMEDCAAAIRARSKA